MCKISSNRLGNKIDRPNEIVAEAASSIRNNSGCVDVDIGSVACLQKIYTCTPENRKCNFHISRRPGCTATIYTVHNVNQFSGNFKKNLHENQDRMGWEVFLKVGYRIFYAI